MTKKQLEKSYQTILEDRQKMLGMFYEIREVIGANPPDRKKDGVAPDTVVNGVKRLVKIGSLIPFTKTQLDEWGQSIWDEMLHKKEAHRGKEGGKE